MKSNVGAGVRVYREAQNLTQQELAQKASTCPGTISLLERGVHPPNRNTLARVARALRVKVKVLEQFEPV